MFLVISENDWKQSKEDWLAMAGMPVEAWLATEFKRQMQWLMDWANPDSTAKAGK